MSYLGQEQEIRKFQDRFKYVRIIMAISFTSLMLRLAYLQILIGDDMRDMSEANRLKKVIIPAPRGMIFDRNQVLIVDNKPSVDIEIIPQYLRESKQTDVVLDKLAKITSMTRESIDERLYKARKEPSFKSVELKRNLSHEELAEVETQKIDLPGAIVDTEIERTHLFGNMTAHAIGYIGKISESELTKLKSNTRPYSSSNYIGKAGLEKTFEDDLRGDDGEETVIVDALGRAVRKDGTRNILKGVQVKEPVPGNNLHLTLDQELQTAASEAFGDKVGAAVAINIHTGEILAMISKPSYDPTEFSRNISAQLWKQLVDNPDHPLINKSYQEHYSPGSSFETFIAIAALEEGLIKDDTVVSCPGTLRVGTKVFHDHKKEGFGSIDVKNALKVSSNVFFYKLAQRMATPDIIAKYAQMFGLGETTNPMFDGESVGIIPTEKWKMDRLRQPWNLGETLSVAIGQSYTLVNILQLANAYATIANGGTLYQPYIVDSVRDVDGNVLRKYEPKIIRKVHVSESTLNAVREGLRRVVNEPGGTTYARRLPDHQFSGKTGTVLITRMSEEKLFSNCESFPRHLRHHGLFAGYAPSENPEIAVAVVAEHACSGSRGAAPVAREIFRKYFERQKIMADQKGVSK